MPTHDDPEVYERACKDLAAAVEAVRTRLLEADNNSVIPDSKPRGPVRVDELPPPSVPHVTIEELHDVVKETLDAKEPGAYERLGVHTTEFPPGALVLKLRAGFALLKPDPLTAAGRLKAMFDQPLDDDETQGKLIAACSNYPPWVAQWASDNLELKNESQKWVEAQSEEEVERLAENAVCMTCTTHNDDVVKAMPSVWYTCCVCGSAWQTDMVFFGFALK